MEQDGYLFAVIAVAPAPRGMVKLTLANEFSPLRITREGQQSITRRASTKVAIARGAGWDVAPTLLHRAITTDLAALARDKPCAKCRTTIPAPELAPSEPERCTSCA